MEQREREQEDSTTDYVDIHSSKAGGGGIPILKLDKDHKKIFEL